MSLPVVVMAEEQVRAVLERFRRGWEKLDADAVLSTVAQRPDVVVYGTDSAERWVGWSSLVDPFRQQVVAFSDARYVWGEGEPLVWVRGDTAWACGDLAVSLRSGERIDVVMRSSFVLASEDGEWRIVHAHFSVGQESQVAPYRVA